MDALNLLIGINLFVSMSANMSAAKKALKSTFTKVKERPKSYLQKVPPNVSAIILVFTILGIFRLGVLSENLVADFVYLRYVGLIIFIVFSWVQVVSYKSLGNSYSHEIVVFREHQLIKKGMYKSIRHPQYVSQILSDIGAGLALMSYCVIPLVLLVEIPLFIMRANFEERLLQNHFGDDYKDYKKKSGFFLPFIG